MEKVECKLCEGTGGTFYSCCGDEMINEDSDICPTCGEHCGEGDLEECWDCNGLGHYFESEDIGKVEEEARRIAIMLETHKRVMESSIKNGVWVGPNIPPRNSNHTTYYNSVTGLWWKLYKGSWRQMVGNNLTRLPKTYLITPRPEYAHARDLMMKVRDKNPCSEIGLDHDIDLRRVNPVSPEQAYWMQEQEGKMVYGGELPASSTNMRFIDMALLPKDVSELTKEDIHDLFHNQTIMYKNARTTNNNTDKPVQDYSIFDS